MMAKDELGAPATIHGRLKSMREKGWIMLADTEDARRKQVELTDDALRHFELDHKGTEELRRQISDDSSRTESATL